MPNYVTLNPFPYPIAALHMAPRGEQAVRSPKASGTMDSHLHVVSGVSSYEEAKPKDESKLSKL